MPTWHAFVDVPRALGVTVALTFRGDKRANFHALLR